MFQVLRKGNIIDIPIKENGRCSLFKRDVILYSCSQCGKESSILAQGLSRYGFHFNDFPIDIHFLCRSCFTKQNNFQKYGVENVSQLEEVKEKKKETSIKNYGVEHPAQSNEIKEKIKQTNLEKYGFENVMSNKNIYDKFNNTILQKYGVENISQLEEVKEKKKETSIKNYGVEHYFKIKEHVKNSLKKRDFDKEWETRKQTNLEKYGVENVLQVSDIKEKIRQTNLEKYGFSISAKNFSVSQKISETLIQDFSENGLMRKIEEDEVLLLDEYDGQREATEDNGILYKKYLFKCKKCGKEFYSSIRKEKKIRCLSCFPYNNSPPEKEILEFIQNFYDGEILTNDKTIIPPYELDVVIPEKNLAIEFNGLYWHSEQKGKDKNYHLNKSIEANEKGYSLIHVFEDEWALKKEIVKSIIKSRMGVFDRRIFARKCSIKEVSSKEVEAFFNVNHLQGYIPSSVNIGIFYEGKLVSCLSFSKPRYNKKYDWEITRFASLLGISVAGGFSRLLKYFTKNYKGDIITYSDRRLFDGNVYRNNGFTELEPSVPNYFYFKNFKRFSRVKFQKHKLKDLLEDFDEELTEKENMENNGWKWVYDCGNWVFEYKEIK